jgi:hypothetical protein
MLQRSCSMDLNQWLLQQYDQQLTTPKRKINPSRVAPLLSSNYKLRLLVFMRSHFCQPATPNPDKKQKSKTGTGGWENRKWLPRPCNHEVIFLTQDEATPLLHTQRMESDQLNFLCATITSCPQVYSRIQTNRKHFFPNIFVPNVQVSMAVWLWLQTTAPSPHMYQSHRGPLAWTNEWPWLKFLSHFYSSR